MRVAELMATADMWLGGLLGWVEMGWVEMGLI